MDELTTIPQPGDLVRGGVPVLAIAGQAANHAASAGVFAEYQERKAANTLARQANDLALFADYLQAAGVPVGDFATEPAAWRGVTWGLVAGFVRWMLGGGYAVSSVNVRLSTVKTYATLASQVGELERQELALIRAVRGYKRADAVHIDEKRKASGGLTRRATRRGPATQSGRPARAGKKADPVSLTKDQAARLKAQPNTPRGRRDALLMCLLLDHGLRVGEVAGLTVDCFNLRAGRLRFYRPKVDKIQTHKLTAATLRAARAYLATDAPAIGPIWKASASKKHGRDAYQAGELTTQGMSARALTQRVRDLGAALGVDGLSAHDCRHYWATLAARNKTPLDRLQDAGGWASLDMPARYIEAAKIANEGVKLE